MKTTVTGKNQVTVPAALATQMGIQAGTRLEWQIGDQKDIIIVRVLPDRGTLAAGLRGRGRNYRKQKGDPVARLIRKRQQEENARTGPRK